MSTRPTPLPISSKPLLPSSSLSAPPPNRLRISLAAPRPGVRLPPAGVSLIIALADPVIAEEGGASTSGAAPADGRLFTPRRAWLVQAPLPAAAPLTAAAAAAAALTAPDGPVLDFTLPDTAPPSSRLPDLLLLAWADHPDFGAVLGKAGPVSRVGSAPSRRAAGAFNGLIPHGASVLAARVPVSSLSATKARGVALRPADLWQAAHPAAAAAGHAGGGGAGPASATGRVQVCVEFDPPLREYDSEEEEEEEEEEEAEEEEDKMDEDKGGGDRGQEPAAAAGPLPSLTVHLRLGRAARTLARPDNVRMGAAAGGAGQPSRPGFEASSVAPGPEAPPGGGGAAVGRAALVAAGRLSARGVLDGSTRPHRRVSSQVQSVSLQTR